MSVKWEHFCAKPGSVSSCATLEKPAPHSQPQLHAL